MLIIDSYAYIHKQSYSRYNISKHFSNSFLKAFYLKAHRSGKVFFKLDNDMGMIGFACVIYDIKKFNEEFKRSYRIWGALELLRIILKRQASIEDVKKYVNAAPYIKEDSAHLGSIAIVREYKGTQKGRATIVFLMGEVYNHLKEKGFKYCTGSTRIDNVATQKFLEREGFHVAEMDDLNIYYFKKI